MVVSKASNAKEETSNDIPGGNSTPEQSKSKVAWFSSHLSSSLVESNKSSKGSISVLKTSSRNDGNTMKPAAVSSELTTSSNDSAKLSSVSSELASSTNASSADPPSSTSEKALFVSTAARLSRHLVSSHKSDGSASARRSQPAAVNAKLKAHIEFMRARRGNKKVRPLIKKLFRKKAREMGPGDKKIWQEYQCEKRLKAFQKRNAKVRARKRTYRRSLLRILWDKFRIFLYAVLFVSITKIICFS